MVSVFKTAPAKRTLAGVLTGALIAGGAVLGSATVAQAAPADVEEATFSWGVRDSWREYILFGAAQGSITVEAPTTSTDLGVISWVDGAGSVDSETYAGEVSFDSDGSVNYYGHDGLLDIKLEDPKIAIEDSTVTLSFVTWSSEATYGSLHFPQIDGELLPFATFALPTPAVSGDVATFTTGEGRFTDEANVVLANMYAPTPIQPDRDLTAPLTFSLPLSEAPAPTQPSVTVSKTSGLNSEGETITVTGTGFTANPPGTNATRAPIGAGNFGGAYVVFAKFPTNWAPSAGGARPSAAILTQKWGVHEFVPGVGPQNGGFILPANGSFEITFDVSDSSDLEGNYGIYTYAGSGAVYAPFETFTPLSFVGSNDVIVTIPEWVDEETGEFGWAFAGSSPADLGTAVQDGGNFVATGALTEIVVTDTRAGGTGGYSWSVAGQVGDFTAGADSFGGEFLGWTPKKVEGGASVVAGDVVTSTQLGGFGLAESKVLGSSNAAASARLGADLQLVIPGTTPAGDYTAKLTITAVS